MKQLLKELPVLPKIKDRVITFKQYTVGVHIRMDSKMANAWETTNNYTQENYDIIKRERTKSHYSNFVAEMLKLEEELHCDFFVCTDTPSILPRMKQIFGQRLHCLDGYSVAEDDVVDRSKEGIQKAFADMLTLANCNAMLGSTWSSFTEVARYLHKTDFDFFKIVGTDF